MSTRYIWGKYNTSTNASYYNDYEYGGYSFIHEGYEDAYYAVSDGNRTVYYASSFTILENTNTYFVKVKLNDPKKLYIPTSSVCTITVPAGNYYALTDTFYAVTQEFTDLLSSSAEGDDNSSETIEELMWEETYDDESGEYKSVYTRTVGRYAPVDLQVFAMYGGVNGNFDYNAIPSPNGYSTLASVSTGRGSFVSYASSSYQKYSSGINSDGYYYSYIGTDNVDPTAVSITSSILNAGSTATVVVTPKSTSYGTLRYTYEYSANNGLWTAITSYNTSTSYSFTIPSGTTTIQVRAQVSDNIGFYSSDYVTSSSYSVNNYTTYASVSGAIKGVNPVVAYGGGTYSKSCCLQKRSYQDFITSIFLVAIVTILQIIFYLKY